MEVAGAVFTPPRDYLGNGRERAGAGVAGVRRRRSSRKENPEARSGCTGSSIRNEAAQRRSVRTRCGQSGDIEARLENVEPSQGLYGYGLRRRIEEFHSLLVIGGMIKATNDRQRILDRD